MPEGSSEGFIPKTDIRASSSKKTAERVLHAAKKFVHRILPLYKSKPTENGQTERVNISSHEQTEQSVSVFPSVSEIARSRNVFFVHGVVENRHHDGNSLLKGSPSLQTQLEVATTLAPSLSASSLQLGDTYRNMWTGAGLLIAEGRITQAGAQDINTRPSGFNVREVSTNTEAKQDIMAQIDNAITNRTSNDRYSYNEFAIASPQFAGLYVSLDPYHNLPEASTLLSSAQELHMPFYIVFQGQLYLKQNVDEAELSYLLSRGKRNDDQRIDDASLLGQGFTRVSPSELIPITKPLTNAEKAQEATKIASQFRLEQFEDIPDAIDVVNYMEGISEFVSLHRQAIVDYCKRNPTLLGQKDEQGLQKIPFLRTNYQEFALNNEGELFATTKYEAFYKIEENSHIRHFLSYGIFDEANPNQQEQEAAILTFAAKMLTSEKPKGYDNRRRIALALHGYADMEEKLGNTEFAEKLREHVEPIVPRAETQNLLNKRINPTTRTFIFLPEDFN